MASDGVPLDDKAKRMRDLLSSFYSPDHSKTGNASSKYATLDTINTTSFSADKYMNLLVQKSSLEGLLHRHVEMAAQIKNLDTDLQMLVYENYNKFISATEAIKRMNGNIVGMEVNMDQLLERIMSVQSRSDGVNTSLFEKREHIEKLHRTRNFLRKVQFIYDLPARLGKCIKSESYADAVKFYIGATPIFKAYGATSFQDCKRASEEAVAIIVKNLQEKLFSDSESIQARAEAAMLLKQLDFPVDTLKAKLLEKLEQSLGDNQLKPEDLESILFECNDASKQGTDLDSVLATAHEAVVREFAEAIRAYRVIFPDSDKQLIKLAQDFITKHFETIEQHVKKGISSANLMIFLRIIWKDVLLIDDVLNEAVLPDFSLEAAQIVVKECIISSFSQLLQDISDALMRVNSKPKEEVDKYPLQVALEASKKTVFQGSMDVFLDFRHFLDDGNVGLVVKQRDSIIHWVQEGFHNFFRALDQRFGLLSGINNSSNQDQHLTEGSPCDKVLPGLVLVLAQLSVFIEQTVIPRITEELAASFSENLPAFVPGLICQIYHSAGEKLLHHYIKLRIQRISVLLRKRFNTPNWIKHKEPREVHMFVDLFLQELQAIRNEVKQILPHGNLRKHRRSDSSGSGNSYLSNTLRDDKMGRSTIQRATSQLLETHLAKLFKQKVDIFTKVAFTQESVVTTTTKLCLKSLQEFVRLQTFNRSGFQQIQLDIQFLKIPVKETAKDEEAVDLLLDEVIIAASERCLDPVHLELPILDKLIQAKLSKSKEQSSIPC